MPGRTNVTISLTQQQRIDLNRTLTRLGLGFSPFVTKAISHALSDKVRLGDLKRAIVNDRDMPRHMRSGAYTANKTVSVPQADVDKLAELGEDYEITVGAAARAAVYLAMDQRIEVFVSPDKVIAKIGQANAAIQAQPHTVIDLIARLDGWFANGGASEGWAKELEMLAHDMGREPWAVLKWLHGEGVDWLRKRQMEDAK